MVLFAIPSELPLLTVPPKIGGYIFKNNTFKMNSGTTFLETTYITNSADRSISITNNAFFIFCGGNRRPDSINIQNNNFICNPEFVFITAINFGSPTKLSAVVMGNSFGITAQNNIFNGFAIALNTDSASSYIFSNNQVNNCITAIQTSKRK